MAVTDAEKRSHSRVKGRSKVDTTPSTKRSRLRLNVAAAWVRRKRDRESWSVSANIQTWDKLISLKLNYGLSSPSTLRSFSLLVAHTHCQFEHLRAGHLVHQTSQKNSGKNTLRVYIMPLMSLVMSRSSTWNKFFYLIWTCSVASQLCAGGVIWAWALVKCEDANRRSKYGKNNQNVYSCLHLLWVQSSVKKEKKKIDPKTHESTSAQFSRDEVILVKSLHFLFSHCSCVTLSDLCAMESTSMEAGTASEQITLIWNQFASAMPLELRSQAARFIHPFRKMVKFRLRTLFG